MSVCDPAFSEETAGHEFGRLVCDFGRTVKPRPEPNRQGTRAPDCSMPPVQPLDGGFHVFARGLSGAWAWAGVAEQ
jgi:hypothetical protein